MLLQFKMISLGDGWNFYFWRYLKLTLVKELKYTTGDYLPLTEGWTKWSNKYFFLSLTLECVVTAKRGTPSELFLLFALKLNVSMPQKAFLLLVLHRRLCSSVRQQSAVLVKAWFGWFILYLNVWLVQVCVVFWFWGFVVVFCCVLVFCPPFFFNRTLGIIRGFQSALVRSWEEAASNELSVAWQCFIQCREPTVMLKCSWLKANFWFWEELKLLFLFSSLLLPPSFFFSCEWGANFSTTFKKMLK